MLAIVGNNSFPSVVMILLNGIVSIENIMSANKLETETAVDP
jgi:hypothetical protein